MIDYFGYTGKVCVVTGAASGIGMATAKLLVDCHAIVYAIDCKKVDIKGIEHFIVADLCKKEEIDYAFSIIPEHIDSFFGVAGLSGARTNYYTTFTVNFIANKYITDEYLVKRMESGASISYVTSTGGLNWQKYAKEFLKFIQAKTWNEMMEILHEQAKEDTIGMMAYPLSKRALNYYSSLMAIQLGERGIRVNALLPGSTDTGMKEEFEVEAGGSEELISHTGVAKRLATPEEMAEPLIFLNSNMARFISGETLIVDYASTAMVYLGMKKDPMNRRVGSKFYNTSLVQNMLKKQLVPLQEKAETRQEVEEILSQETKTIKVIEPNTEELKKMDDEVL